MKHRFRYRPLVFLSFLLLLVVSSLIVVGAVVDPDPVSKVKNIDYHKGDRQLIGDDFVQLQVFWDEDYIWSSIQVMRQWCATCAEGGCSNGNKIVLKECDIKDINQRWHLTDDGKLSPESKSTSCMSFKSLSKVTLQRCTSERDKFQLVELDHTFITISETKFQIHDVDGECLAPVDNPNIDDYLIVVNCRKAVRNAGAYWVSGEFHGHTPSAKPSATPTVSPSSQPSASPSTTPTSSPSVSPTDFPSTSPSSHPTQSPSLFHSSYPTTEPTVSRHPSFTPTSGPSVAPTISSKPTISNHPSNVPSKIFSAAPTISMKPSNNPSNYPSNAPSVRPSWAPSSSPTAIPSAVPSDRPSWAPSSSPTAIPSAVPTTTSLPSAEPSTSPSNTPTTSMMPSNVISMIPSNSPTQFDTNDGFYNKRDVCEKKRDRICPCYPRDDDWYCDGDTNPYILTGVNNVAGDKKFGPCDTSKFDRCRKDQKLCPMRKPRLDRYYDDDISDVYYYIDYDCARCVPQTENCSKCSPGIWCEGIKRCVGPGKITWCRTKFPDYEY